MPDYSKAKIFAICSKTTNKCYIGQTTSTLQKRLSVMRLKRNHVSHEILKHPDAFIKLIENYPCENIRQLNKRREEILRDASIEQNRQA